MRSWIAAVGACSLAGALGVLVPGTAGAADAPVVAAPTSAVALGDSYTVTLTGCDGPTAPTLFVNLSGFSPKTQENPVPITESTPGVWTYSTTAEPGSDPVYTGQCSSGARSAPVRVDVEWREMFTDPFDDAGGPLIGVNGTDCSDGSPVVVTFRVEDRFWEVRPPVDAGGDWYAAAPVIPPGSTGTVIGRCGSWRYIPVSWSNGVPHPPAPTYPSAAGILSPGEGPVGTAITGSYLCYQPVTVVVHDADDDTVAPVEVTKTDGAPVYTWAATAGETDSTFEVTCGKAKPDALTFDVENPVLAAVPAAASGLPPERIRGTDCPPATEASVVVAFGATEAGVTTAPDLFGDWSIAAPAPGGGVTVRVTAFCGSVTYDPVSYVSGAAAPGAPGAVATPAAPADAVPGQASYTG